MTARFDRYTLVLSDVHLCGVVPDGTPWMAYRQRRFLFDADLAALLDGAAGAARGAALEVVFNGDLFDLDAPDVRGDPRSFRESTSHDEAGAAALLGAVLDDHPAVVGAVGRVLAAGHRVVFVPGNHDAQLAFPEVRRVLAARLAAASDRSDPRVAFRTLFHRTADGLHVEHGHQYDPLCALDAPLPYREAGRLRLEETLGSVASYYLPALLGCANPYASDPFDVGAGELLAAARRCGSAGLPASRWGAAAAAGFARQLALVRAAPCPAARAAVCAAAAAETATDPAAVRAHAALFAPKVAAGWAVAGDARRGYGAEVDRRVRAAAYAAARLYGAAGVVMGHTHVAHGGWDGGRFFANTGSWAPAVGLPAGVAHATGSYVWVASGRGALRAGSYRWAPAERA